MHLSPWSERARWSLDHHRLPYKEVEYTPMLSEARVRFKLGRAGGRVTVPILFGDGVVLRDSFDIARHADVIGSAQPLFPADTLADITAWNERVEPGLHAGRSMTVRRTAKHSGARRDSLPKAVPQWMKPVLEPVASMGVRYFEHKYGLGDRTAEQDEATLRDVLVEIRNALGQGSYLLGDRFTFADVIASGALQFVVPLDDQWRRATAAEREVWGTPSLADEFADLVSWRDALYAKHR